MASIGASEAGPTSTTSARERAGAPLLTPLTDSVQAGALAEAPAPPEKTVSLTGMTINLVTGGLGSGILTLPWGMAGASVIVSVVLILLVVALNFCTVMLLVRAAEKHKRFDLGALLAELPGRRLGPLAQGATNALVWITLWMTLVGYIIVVQDCVTPLFPAGSPMARRWVWGVLASAVALALSLKDLRFLSWTSSPLSVAVNCYLFGLLCVRLASSGVSPDGPCLLAKLAPPPRGVVAFLSLISCSIIIQMCILPMYKVTRNLPYLTSPYLTPCMRPPAHLTSSALPIRTPHVLRPPHSDTSHPPPSSFRSSSSARRAASDARSAPASPSSSCCTPRSPRSPTCASARPCPQTCSRIWATAAGATQRRSA